MKNIKFAEHNSSAERFYKSVSILIVTVLLFLLLYAVSFSWFGESKDATEIVTVGNISISVQTDIDFSSTVLEPNKEYAKVTTIIGASDNTNDAFVKVKLETTLKANGQNVIVPIYNQDLWIYDNSSGWYYLKGFVNKNTGVDFNSALKVSNDLTNLHKSQTTGISLTVHAIQKDYDAYINDAGWSNAPQAWKDYVSGL